MSRHLIRFAVLALLVTGAAVAFARSTGAPRGATGAPAVGAVAAEQTCYFCHDDSNGLNDPSGAVEILDLPALFDLDTDYVLRVRLSRTWDPLPPDPLRWGFELTAVRADSGTGYGTFTPGTGTQITTLGQPGLAAHASRRYLTHTNDGTHTGSSGPVEWTITWRSPGYVAGKVQFFVAGNATDGNGSPAGDWVFTNSASMDYVNVGVGDGALAGTDLAPPTPQPAPGRCQIRYSLATAGAVDLALYDAQGRRVRTLVRGEQPAGPGIAHWDGRDENGSPARAGVYFARLIAPGHVAARVQKVVLAR